MTCELSACQLIFSLKKKKKKYFRMSSAAFVTGALRVTIVAGS